MDDAFKNFSGDLNVAVIGASGCIGYGFIEHFMAHQRVKKIYALSRSEAEFTDRKVISLPIDLTDENSIKDAVSHIKDPLDIAIVATGLLHCDQIKPEKTFKSLDMEAFNTVFTVNTFGPALVAKHFLPLLRKDQRAVFAALSARVGSISDNQLGGWYAYRASKAALNMLLKCAAIEMSRKQPDTIIIGLHPGTVDTDLSKPFQSYVKPEKLFTHSYATERMLAVIDNVKSGDSGNLFAYDGAHIPF